MSYKVLYIDDNATSLLERLEQWNGYQYKGQRPEDTHEIQFAGLSFRYNENNNQQELDDCEMYYVDIDEDAERWEALSYLEQDRLQAQILSQCLRYITEIQPDAILLDIHLGHRSVIKGPILLKEIRKYYPYMAVVMITTQPDNPYILPDLEEYPLAEYVLGFADADVENLYRDACKWCSQAIDYRGISLQEYQSDEIDHRLPDISQALIQEIVNSPLFDENNKDPYPIVFLDGSFGSGRHLFALWMNALLQRRRENASPSPSVLTEINCSCLSSFDKDKDSKAYLEKIFEPSRGGILFLTEVDRLPDTMQKAFKTVIRGWKKNACIVATATDSKRVGLERLPKGVNKIGSYQNWEAEGYSLSLLSPQSTEDFKNQLQEEQIVHQIVDCKSFDYATSLPSFKEEADRLQNEIENCPQNPCILVVQNITALEKMSDGIKQAFQKWLDRVKQNACVIVNRIYNTATARRLLPQVLPNGYVTVKSEDIEKAKLKVEHDKVFYFGYDIRSEGENFTDYIKRLFDQDENVWGFHCGEIFTPSIESKKRYLLEKLKLSEECELLFLENIDKIPDDYLAIFKDVIQGYATDTKVVTTVTDSGSIACQNLTDNNEVMQIRLPSLQERFNGKSFIESNDIKEGSSIKSNNINDFLDSVFPSWLDVANRVGNRAFWESLPLEIQNYYRNRLTDIKDDQLNVNEQRDIKQIRQFLNQNTQHGEINKFSFEKLCQSIIERIDPIIDSPTLGHYLSISSEIFLAIQMHDWPTVIFNQSRSIYELEEILKNAATTARQQEIKINDIKISKFSRDAERMISDANASNLSRSNAILGFEILTRAYARNYEIHVDAANEGNLAFNGKELIEDLRGEYDTIRGMGILTDTRRTIASAQGLLKQ